jgi:transposase-like protein
MLGLTLIGSCVTFCSMDSTVEAGKPLTTQPSITLAELMKQFGNNEEACKTLLRDLRWPDGVKCPRCGRAERVYALKARPFHWACKNPDCGKRDGYRFSVITKTIFENTNYPLRTWFQVIYLMTQSKKGISALQIHRQIRSGDYRTAWYMLQRVRAAMQDNEFSKLMGTVEVDETYIGGKDRKRHASKRSGKRGTSGKIPVIGAIARKGNVVCQIIENADTPTLDRFVRKVVSDKVSLVATDEHSGYRLLENQGYKHETVRHSQGEYVRGEVHTQNIDSFWSLLKRGIVGTYHNVSKKYLPLYLAEFQYRFNNRKNPNVFFDVVAGC